MQKKSPLELKISTLENNESLIKELYKNLEEQLKSFNHLINDNKYDEENEYKSDNASFEEDMIEEDPESKDANKFEQLSRSFVDQLVTIKAKTMEVIEGLVEREDSLRSTMAFGLFINEALEAGISEELTNIIEEQKN